MNSGAGSVDQHQKDFFDPFFPPEASSSSSEHVPGVHDHHLHHQRLGGGNTPQDIFHGNLGSSNSGPPTVPSMMNMQQQQQQQSMMGGSQFGVSGIDINMLENLMVMQERAGQAAATVAGGMGGQTGQTTTPQMLLEQQMRLNQLQTLQQLQNRIFQQQMELLTGNSSLSGIPPQVDRSREQQQYGLPTPASSTELHAQHSTDFVSPMLLQSNSGSMNNLGPSPQMPPSYMPQHMIPPTPHSAPANIVFSTGAYPLPSPAELEFGEISPLTSPWLGAYSNNSSGSQQSGTPGGRPTPPQPSSSTSTGKKRRTSSPSGDDELSNNNSGRPSRKRQPATNRLTSNMPSLSSNKKANLRGTRSANSTPLFPAVASSRITPAHYTGPLIPSVTDVPGDTPSPVDLTMPPPAPPPPTVSSTPMQFTQGPGPACASTSGHNTPGANNPPPEHLMPVTPASIMNLGRLGTNSALAPPPATQGPSHNAQEKTTKGKTTARSRASTNAGAQSGTNTGARGSNNNASLISPSLKPIRPAGGASMNSISPVTQTPQPILRKTSHKAAEQKRRDSLKTSFDDLRMLLPPIPLPSDEGYPDEPVLPGAMPPRGPPKGNVEGPNRGVSKLQLLRCGNDFIRVLKARVERRDDEIEKLRQEIVRLRLIVGEEQSEGMEGETIDLEKNLDAVETAAGGVFAKGQAGLGGIVEEYEGDEDGGE